MMKVPSRFDEQIGSKIKNVRQILEISEKELCEKTGITAEELASYEYGRVSATISDLYKIVSVFNISLSYFLKDW